MSDADVAALLERCLRLHPQDNTVRSGGGGGCVLFAAFCLLCLC